MMPLARRCAGQPGLGGGLSFTCCGWQGDPEILLYGLDYQGNLCGSGSLEDFKVR